MEPQARYAVVGVSVVALVALLAASVAWMLTSGNSREVHRYTLYFARQSLEGLEPHSEVRMKGIRVGSVTGFSFSTRQPGSVEVLVEVDATAPVRESTRAVVDRNLITGLASIRLLTLDEGSPLLSKAPPGEAHAVIAEGESQLQQFSQTMNQLAQRADDTMKLVGETLSPANRAAVAETLENLRVASRQASTIATRLDTTLVSLRRTADGLHAATRVATDDLHRLADRYDTLGAQTGIGIQEATAVVQQVGADVSRLATRTEHLLIDADVELRLTGEQVRSTADALGATSRKLADPRAVLFGPAQADLGPGEVPR
jgi:phospholipid/cholesterol/gamma-HCH transport system substrate-binding protein